MQRELADRLQVSARPGARDESVEQINAGDGWRGAHHD
jgi:hypothetical protein